MNTPDTLFEQLKTNIEALQLEERLKKEPIEAAYEEFRKPFAEEFNQATKAKQDWAREIMAPEKKAMDEAVFAITRSAGKKIDARVKKYVAWQKTIEQQFYADDTVIAALAAENSAIAEEKARVEAELKAISDETDAKIAALQAEYEAQCASLENIEPGKPEDWADVEA